jgi:hypothetical protein
VSRNCWLLRLRVGSSVEELWRFNGWDHMIMSWIHALGEDSWVQARSSTTADLVGLSRRRLYRRVTLLPRGDRAIVCVVEGKVARESDGEVRLLSRRHLVCCAKEECQCNCRLMSVCETWTVLDLG